VIPLHDLIFMETLGEGEFGQVRKATIRDNNPLAGRVVAIKSGKSGQNLLDEFTVQREVDHVNVIKMLGVSFAADGRVLIVMEFAENGSLRDYLRASRGILAVSRSVGSFTAATSGATTITTDEPRKGEAVKVKCEDRHA